MKFVLSSGLCLYIIQMSDLTGFLIKYANEIIDTLLKKIAMQLKCLLFYVVAFITIIYCILYGLKIILRL